MEDTLCPFLKEVFMAEKEEKQILNPRENNKTNRERREKEERQTKILKTAGAIVAGIVIICIIAGLIYGIINKPSRKTVAKVGDESISLEEFQSAVRMQRSNVNNNYQYMQQLYSMFGMDMDENTRESYAMQMSDSYKGLMGQQVLSNLVNQKVLAYGAAQEGIEVSDAEVDERYKGMFAYYPNGTPTAAPTDEPFAATPTVTDEQLAILKYTETPLPTEIPVETEEAAAVEDAESEVLDTNEETLTDTAEVEETGAEVEETVEKIEAEAEEAAAEVEEAVENVEAEAADAAEETADLVKDALSEPTAAPTPTVYTEDMFKQYESVYFANNYYYSKDFFKNQLKYELLQNKVEEKLEEGMTRSADMVWARHILVETEEEAQAALDRINAGEDWGAVAAEVSTDSTASNGGDLGWFTEGTMVQAFDDAAFSQEVGTISDPVQTDFGWHLIQVIAHEDHPLTKNQYDSALESAYQEWLDGYASQLDISMENVTDLTPTDPAFIG
jgi:parvulin-like peptidyl-prolyl isomerase